MELKTRRQLAAEKRIQAAEERRLEKVSAFWRKRILSKLPSIEYGWKFRLVHGHSSSYIWGFYNRPLEGDVWEAISGHLREQGTQCVGRLAGVNYWVFNGPEMRSLILDIGGRTSSRGDSEDFEGNLVYVVTERKL